jgi:hypothetical protein
VSISGQMEDDSRAVGRKISFMDGEYTPGLMVEATTESTTTTKSTGLASMFGQIRRSTRGTGTTENNTARESSQTHRGSQGSANGRMESALSGCLVLLRKSSK